MASSAHRENFAMALDTRMELVKWERGNVAEGRGFSEVGRGGGLRAQKLQKVQRNVPDRIWSLQSSVCQIGSLIETKAINDSELS